KRIAWDVGDPFLVFHEQFHMDAFDSFGKISFNERMYMQIKLSFFFLHDGSDGLTYSFHDNYRSYDFSVFVRVFLLSFDLFFRTVSLSGNLYQSEFTWR